MNSNVINKNSIKSQQYKYKLRKKRYKLSKGNRSLWSMVLNSTDFAKQIKTSNFKFFNNKLRIVLNNPNIKVLMNTEPVSILGIYSFYSTTNLN